MRLAVVDLYAVARCCDVFLDLYWRNIDLFMYGDVKLVAPLSMVSKVPTPRDIDAACASILRSVHEMVSDEHVRELLKKIEARCRDVLRNCPSPSCPRQHLEEYREMCSFLANYLGCCGDRVIDVVVLCLGRCIDLGSIGSDDRDLRDLCSVADGRCGYCSANGEGGVAICT